MYGPIPICVCCHAACHNSTAHGEHLAATVTRARCRKQTGEEGVRGWSAVGQPTSLPIVGRLMSTLAASAQRMLKGTNTSYHVCSP